MGMWLAGRPISCLRCCYSCCADPVEKRKERSSGAQPRGIGRRHAGLAPGVLGDLHARGNDMELIVRGMTSEGCRAGPACAMLTCKPGVM